MIPFFTQLMTDPIVIEKADSVKSSFSQWMENLSSMSAQDLFKTVANGAVSIALKIVIALVIFWVGRWLIRRVRKMMDRIMTRRNVDVSLRAFLISLVTITMMLFLIIITIGILGIDTTSFIALFASAGLAIGMALSGTLQNFAGGVMILLFRPYKVGDYIMAQGQAGTVTDIRIFSTQIRTVDNRVIYIPNNSISTSIIDNYSQERLRRVDWSVSVGYGVDAERVRSLLLSIIATDGRVVAEPAAPVVYLASMNESSVTFSARAWVRNADYWDTFFEINEKIYGTLPAEGVSFPYPKLDVTINNNNTN